MLGLSTATEIRLAAWAILALGIAGWMTYERFHLVDEGIAKQKAADDGAREVHDKQVATQHAKDLKDAGDVIDSLHGQLEALRAAAANPPAGGRAVRLCLDAHSSNQGRPTVPAAGGGQPAQPANGAGNQGLRSGTGAGPDIGPGMRDLALAGELLADYRQACVSWALKQGQSITR